jgi:N-acetylglucosaminyl-diphospho-decaprenol L-rhamnosyltransferase
MYCSIILVNYNGSEFLADCLQSILHFVDFNACEVIIVDNASTDDSVNIIKNKFSSFKLICSSVNLGFSKANNLAVKHSIGKHLLFLNTDTILLENSPQILSDYLTQHQDVGVISARIIFEDSSYQLSSGRLPNIVIELFDKIRYGLDKKWHNLFAGIYTKKYSTVKEVGWVTGACLMICRDVFEQLGGFDESFFMYFEDKDICKRINDIGFKVIYYPLTSIIHLLGGSSQSIKKNINTYYRDSQLHYYQKHLGHTQIKILKLYLRTTGRI